MSQESGNKFKLIQIKYLHIESNVNLHVVYWKINLFFLIDDIIVKNILIILYIQIHPKII